MGVTVGGRLLCYYKGDSGVPQSTVCGSFVLNCLLTTFHKLVLLHHLVAHRWLTHIPPNQVPEKSIQTSNWPRIFGETDQDIGHKLNPAQTSLPIGKKTANVFLSHLIFQSANNTLNFIWQNHKYSHQCLGHRPQVARSQYCWVLCFCMGHLLREKPQRHQASQPDDQMVRRWWPQSEEQRLSHARLIKMKHSREHTPEPSAYPDFRQASRSGVTY